MFVGLSQPENVKKVGNNGLKRQLSLKKIKSDLRSQAGRFVELRHEVNWRQLIVFSIPTSFWKNDGQKRNPYDIRFNSSRFFINLNQ